MAADVDGGGDGRARHSDARRAQPDRGGPLRAPGGGTGGGPHAVAELSIASASDCLARWPPPLAPQRGTPVEQSLLSKWWLFVALASAYVLAYRRKLPDFVELLVAAPLGIGPALAVQLGDTWPLSPSLYAPLAGGAAIVAPPSRSGWWCPVYDDAADHREHVVVGDELADAGRWQVRVVVVGTCAAGSIVIAIVIVSPTPSGDVSAQPKST